MRDRPARPPRRCGCCTTSRSTRSSSTSQMPGPHRPRARPVLSRFTRRRRRSSSSPRTTSTRWTPSSSTPSTTCSSRCATSGCARPCAGSCDDRPPARAAGRGDHRGRARRRHPLRAPARTCATSRRRATTPGCTRRPGSHLVRIPLAALEERWRDAGFVRIHRSLLVALGPRRRGPLRGRAVHGPRRRHRARGEPPAHPRPARPAAAQPPGRAVSSAPVPAAATGAGHRPAPPAGAPAYLGGVGDRRADRARRGLHELADAHPAAAGHRACWRVLGRDARPAAAALRAVPALAARACSARCRCPGWSSAWSSTRCCSASAGFYVRRAERNERAFRDLVGPR